MLSVFFHFVFFVSGSVSLSLFGEIFGSELLFLCVGVGRVFFGAVLPMLLLYYSFFRSRNCLGRILLMSGLVFWVFFLLLWFFRRRRRPFVCLFFLFKRKSSASNRSHPHTRLCFFLFFFVPPQLVCSPVLAVRPFLLAFCRGAILGPGRFLDSLGTSLRLFSRTRGGKGVSLLLVSCFVFPRFVLFCGRALFLEARVGFLAEVGSPV